MADHPKHRIICLIQINTYIQETLDQYYIKVKGQEAEPLKVLDTDIDFTIRCPICGAQGCALFIGYYYREVIGEDGRYYNRFPIARYVCRGKGKPKVKDKTFSLLPYQLVPYSKYCIAFIIRLLELRHIQGYSLYALQDHVAGFGQEDILCISADQLKGFRQLIMEAIEKIKAAGYYSEFVVKDSTSADAFIAEFIDYAAGFECSKVSPPIRGPCGLGYDFYLNSGGYFANARFLFGTPSQFR